MTYPANDLVLPVVPLVATPASRTAEGDVDRAQLAGWQHTLNTLEDDVARAGLLAAGKLMRVDEAADPLTDESLTLASLPSEATAWEPPSHLGPLPVQLAERARELLDRQIKVAADLARSIAVGRQQANYAAHIDTLYGTRPNAAFVDEAV